MSDDYRSSLDEEKLQYSISDKFTGIFYEPTAVFQNIFSFPLRNSDWLVPLFLSILISVFAYAIYMTNPVIKRNVIEKKMEQIAEGLNKAVKEGKLTEQQADEQLEKTREYFDKPLALVIEVVSIIIGFLILFFIMTFFYFALAKLFFGYNNSYQSALVAYGMSYYIFAAYSLINFIFSLVREDIYVSLSLASVLNVDKNSYYGLVLNLIDPFAIWQLIVIGIGLSVLSKSEKKKSLFYFPIAVWILYKISIFFLAQNFEFFKSFNI